MPSTPICLNWARVILSFLPNQRHVLSISLLHFSYFHFAKIQLFCQTTKEKHHKTLKRNRTDLLYLAKVEKQNKNAQKIWQSHK
jgi:hypothetical protein